MFILGDRACPTSPIPGPSANSPLEVFDHASRIQQRYLVHPATPGAAPIAPDAAPLIDHDKGQRNGTLFACSLCRGGDVLFPIFAMTAASDGFLHAGEAVRGLGYRNFTFHLFRDGTEIPQTPIVIVPGVISLPAFTLPADPGTYWLTAQGPGADITWTFASARPTTDAVRPGYVCVFGFRLVNPCQAEPFLFANYDLGDTLDQRNTVAAGRKHRFQVNVTQPQTPTAPKVAGLKLWVSTDDGAHWKPATVKRDHGNTFTASTTYPDFSNTTGAVSLKVEAWDTNGNRIEQTSTRAFALRDTRPHVPSNAL
jgi:hypothetical protein